MIIRDIELCRDVFIEEVRKCENVPILLKGDESFINSILFYTMTDDDCDKIVKKEFALPIDVLEKLDFSTISFDSFTASGVDFSKFHNVTLDPQTVYNKNLYGTVLTNVNIKSKSEDPFEGVCVIYAIFTGSAGAVMDPQTVKCKDLYGTVLTDVEIKSLSRLPFAGVNVINTVFPGSRTVQIEENGATYKKMIREQVLKLFN